MEKFFCKLLECLSSFWGILLSVAVFVAEFLGGYELCIYSILVFILMDLGWGIAVALKCNKYTLSESIRNTISKLMSYYSCILGFIVIEKLLGVETPWGVIVISSLIGITELWSISGNMLIINPNIPFLSLLRPALIGEISRKLNMNEQEVKDILNKGESLTKHQNTK